VDDDPDVREMLALAVRRAGIVCHAARDADAALTVMAHHPVDVVLTDIRMPGISGIELTRIVRERGGADVIVMTGFSGDFTYEDIIRCGASDFVLKPARPGEIVLRLRRVLRERALLSERARQHRALEAAHEALHGAVADTIQRLVVAAEFKDAHTGAHIQRMVAYARLLAERLGMPDETLRRFTCAVPMHDVGKIGIPDHILLKDGPLSGAEFDVIKTHTTIGARILGDADGGILRMAREIALHHHEHWNGRGYPGRLRGEAIPACGRIVALVDVFDALTSPRPYKDPYPLNFSLAYIRRQRWARFAPELTDLFLDAADDIDRIRRDHHGRDLPDEHRTPSLSGRDRRAPPGERP